MRGLFCKCLGFFVFLFVGLSICFLPVEAGIALKVLGVNPSTTQRQSVPVKVYLPNLFIGSATTNKATTHPAKYPIEYKKPSYPTVAIIPQIPKKEAADK